MTMDMLGERSSPVGDGRYRIFYKISIRRDNDFEITLLDIDDNRESNLDRFPVHRLRSFLSDEWFLPAHHAATFILISADSSFSNRIVVKAEYKGWWIFK